MASLENILGVAGALSARQVQVGRIWVDPANLESHLHKYCKHIFVHTEHPDFPYTFRGSGTALRIANRHFVFCCHHQIADQRPEAIAIRPSFEAKTLTSSGMRLPTVTEDNRGDDVTDVVGIEYAVENYDIPNLSSDFFPVTDDRVWPNGSNSRIPFLLYGYPTDQQDVDYEGQHIRARTVCVKGIYDGGTGSTHLHRVKLDRIRTFDFDGMSGGPVFYVGGHPGHFFVGLAGMTMRGGANSEYAHFIAADFLLQIALYP
jgi:hypothetical protein